MKKMLQDEDRSLPLEAAFSAAELVYESALQLFGDIGYWGEGAWTDEERLACAESDMKALLERARALELQIARLHRAVHGEPAKDGV